MTTYEKKINIILTDLYALDPSLQEHDAVLRKAVHALIAARPEAELDETFRLHLREELLAKADHMHFRKLRAHTIFDQIRTHRTMIYAASGTFASALIVLVAVLALGGGPASKDNGSPIENILTSAVSITPVGEQAFGPLILSSFGDGKGGGMGGDVAMGEADGGSPATTDNMALRTGEEASGSAPAAAPSLLAMPTTPNTATSDVQSGTSEKMIAPPYYEQTVYTYTYTGDPLALTEEKVGVLRRIKGTSLSNGAFSGLLDAMNTDLLDLSTFPSLGLKNFSAADTNENYYVSVDLGEGTISISSGAGSLDMAYTRCASERCMPNPLAMSDIPADTMLISLANQFVALHRIGTDHYGAPFVDSNWKSWNNYGGEVYVPDSISVIYPLVIEGMNVYDESGNPLGMSVNVNIRSKTVTGAWDITSHRYERSLYTAETNADRILKVAEQGGYRQYYPYYYDNGAESSGTKRIDVKIGAPETVYMKFWKYDETKGVSDELLVPALAFPVVSKPTEGDFPPAERIIVPLAKELLDQMETAPQPILY